MLVNRLTARGSVRGGKTTIFSRLCTTIFHSSYNTSAMTATVFNTHVHSENSFVQPEANLEASSEHLAEQWPHKKRPHGPKNIRQQR